VASLLRDRRFAPLFWCQFLAAFGDNALKSALTFVLVWGIGGAGAAPLVVLAGALFIAPFFLLSGVGGQLADRFDKALLARRIKFAELGAAGLAAAGVALGSVPLLFASLLAFGIASALFGPVKYGLLPDQLAPEQLPAANALVEAATFLAILGGTVAGSLATTVPVPLAGAIAVCSVLAWIAARLIPPTGRGAPDLHVQANILASTAALLRGLRKDRRAWRAGLFNAWFWLAGSVALALLPPLVKDTLGGSERAATLALCVFAIGVALGSGAAAWLSGGRIILLPCVLGAGLVGAALLDLWWTTRGLAPVAAAGLRAFLTQPGRVHALLDLAALAAGGGLIAVPSFAAVQAWAGAERRARSVAAVNVLSAAAIVAGALVTAPLQHAGLGTPALFGLLGAASLVAAALMLATLPTNAVRDGRWMRSRFWRIQVRG